VIHLNYDNPWKEALNHFFQPFVELCLPDLAKQFELQYKVLVEQLEEEKHVAYITSIERIAKKQGWEKGLQEDQQEVTRELATPLLQENTLSVEKIVKITNLPLEVLRALANQNQH
jgi:predicted transposase YdaD